MKDFTREELESNRPPKDALDVLDFCLDRLYNDTQKRTTDELAHGLTYEELIGTLLLARDEINNDRAGIEDFDLDG